MERLERIVLDRPVSGLPVAGDFRIEEAALPEPGEGQFLIRHHYVSADPGTRSRLSGQASYAGALAIGAVIDGFAVGKVIASRNARFPEGMMVTCGGGWATHSLSNGRGFIAPVPELGVADHHWIGVLGVPGMTAWFGLRRVGSFRSGDRVLVTSAAGPVGATAGQLAKAWGAAQVVGVARGADRCAWLLEAGFDAALDMKAPDFHDALAAAMPDGIDLLFDNVGTAMVSSLMPLMRSNGRIVISGQVADYNLDPEQRPKLAHTDRFITHRLRMEGLVVFDDLRAFPEAQAAMAGMIKDGSLATSTIISQGLASLPEAFCGLFQPGAGFGRRLARLVA
jgi:NADPH-dependent curcumin reductase